MLVYRLYLLFSVQHISIFLLHGVVASATAAVRRLRLILMDASANSDIDLVVLVVVDGPAMVFFHSLSLSSIHSSIAFGDGI